MGGGWRSLLVCFFVLLGFCLLCLSSVERGRAGARKATQCLSFIFSAASSSERQSELGTVIGAPFDVCRQQVLRDFETKRGKRENERTCGRGEIWSMPFRAFSAVAFVAVFPHVPCVPFAYTVNQRYLVKLMRKRDGDISGRVTFGLLGAGGFVIFICNLWESMVRGNLTQHFKVSSDCWC